VALLLVENKENGPTVWGEHAWAPKGDPNGDDVLRLPDTLLDDPSFLQALASGHLTVIDPPPEVEERMAAMRIGDRSAGRRGRAADATASVMATIDRRHDRDLVAQTCLGPGPRGVPGGCEAQVIRRGTEQDGPPLCGSHRHLADQFVQIQGAAGQAPTWTQVTR
jgi:hypothetical protein